MAFRMSGSERSKEAPMDFEFTSRPEQKPAWTMLEQERTPQKRGHADMKAPPNSSNRPIFGPNQNIPFLFETPRQQSPSPSPWHPPSNFSPSKIFAGDEIKDVDMADASPPNVERPKTDRPIATGGLRRVYNARHKAGPSGLSVVRTRTSNEDDWDSEESDEDAPVSRSRKAVATSNHYTLNLPGPQSPQSDTPYILLGYLQFFFNLSLILIFLYLTIQFILTVQRDVEHRISEYSMDIVQEIAMCGIQYKNNNCIQPIPAMVQQCGAWDTCMNRDPTIVGRARVGAELIAEVVNGFVEPISWKTLAFTLTSLSFLTVFINTLLSLYRSRLMPTASPVPAPPTPYPNPFGYFSPTATPSWARTSWKGEEPETPTRRRRLDDGGVLKVK